MINVPRALRTLAGVGYESTWLAGELHISPYLVDGWRDGSPISDASLRMLRRWLEGELRMHNAGPTYTATGAANWVTHNAALRTAYGYLIPDPSAELVESVRATLRAAGSLVPVASSTDPWEKLAAPFRHRNHALHDRIDRAFGIEP